VGSKAHRGLSGKNIPTGEPQGPVDTEILETRAAHESGQQLPLGPRMDTFGKARRAGTKSYEVPTKQCSSRNKNDHMQASYF
jgi:hypothetical protein